MNELIQPIILKLERCAEQIYILQKKIEPYSINHLEAECILKEKRLGYNLIIKSF